MKRLVFPLAIVALLAGCVGIGAVVAPAPAVRPEVFSSGIRLTVEASQAVYQPDEPVLLKVTVKNEGDQPVSYLKGSSSCGDGLSVGTESGVGHFRSKADRDGRACTEDIAMAELKPGEQIAAAFDWDQVHEEIPVAPGDYPIRVRFQRGQSPESLDPVEMKLTVKLEGNPVYITRDQAVELVKADPAYQEWVKAHTGDAVVRQDGEQVYVLRARDLNDPTGEWVPVLGAPKDLEPQIDGVRKDMVWRIKSVTKYGPAPRQYNAYVDLQTGKLLDEKQAH